ncbi:MULTISPECIES: hypothetical protein [Bacillus cereus group]|uniref:hypothetical protein n=1 Tax=Bacillus cereus group TaxID=86661 RepID=UPI001F1AE68F|nr:hypothetical protein [Bacillus cereus]MDA1521015.1 hypothetical protein [Bacillus cereus]BCC09450.1 hypothetical protein BCM0060_p2116 [Bacillus cereus]BCC16671.1 hypothetical protein BCM0075_1441 [Bacillus cereus]BCC50452.1 hypothetical protein BCJMU02_p2046 [Bacillus cereus]BCD08865.1 hypothetical protein BC30052_p2147 [Bacillus cereus]
MLAVPHKVTVDHGHFYVRNYVFCYIEIKIDLVTQTMRMNKTLKKIIKVLALTIGFTVLATVTIYSLFFYSLMRIHIKLILKIYFL